MEETVNDTLSAEVEETPSKATFACVHTLEPAALFLLPGAVCTKCDYWKTLTVDEFKRRFGRKAYRNVRITIDAQFDADKGEPQPKPAMPVSVTKPVPKKPKAITVPEGFSMHHGTFTRTAPKRDENGKWLKSKARKDAARAYEGAVLELKARNEGLSTLAARCTQSA